jgi:hypothetical protein
MKSSLVDNYTVDTSKLARSNYEKEGKHTSYLNQFVPFTPESK